MFFVFYRSDATGFEPAASAFRINEGAFLLILQPKSPVVSKSLIDLGTVIDSVERTPEISTFAHGEFEEAGASKSIFSATDAVVLDEVSYENLDMGKTYLLKASLHVVETAEDGTTQTHPVTNALDEPLETSHIFIATASHATTQVSITFDATNYADQTLVVYEELYEDNTTSPLATHADPLDTDLARKLFVWRFLS